jgi:hypothetical protein
MAMALRPRRSAAMISSRCGSHALALGARPGCRIAPDSVDTSALVAGFAGSESVDTGSELAGFDRPKSVDISGGELPVLPSIRSGALVHAPVSPRLSGNR